MQKYRNQLIGGFLAAIVIYVLYVFGAELLSEDESAFIYVQQFPLELVLPLVLLQIAAFFFRWVEWHYYLGVIGVRRKISVMDSMILQIASFTMAASPAKAGEFLKSVLLKVKTGAEISRSAPIVLAERVVDGIAVILLLAVAVVWGGDTTQLQGWQRNSITLSAAILLTGLIVVQIRPLAHWGLNLLKYIPYVRRAQPALTDFYESSREIFHLRHVVPMVMVGVGVYATTAATMYLILVGFGQPHSVELFLHATVISGIAAAVGALSGSPNGAGVTEGSTQWILMNTLGFSSGLALAAGLMHGFFSKWFRVFWGMLVALIYRRRLFSGDWQSALEDAEREKQVRHDAALNSGEAL